jgi:hypothetical protein
MPGHCCWFTHHGRAHCDLAGNYGLTRAIWVADYLHKPTTRSLSALQAGVTLRRESLGATLAGLQEMLVYGLKGMAAYTHHAGGWFGFLSVDDACPGSCWCGAASGAWLLCLLWHGHSLGVYSFIMGVWIGARKFFTDCLSINIG